MIKNKTFINFIMVTLMVSFLTISVGKVSPVYGMAAFPIGTVQPVYDTEIIALYDYVSENLEQPQLDIFFFLGGALAVAQLGAQNVLLESPYPNETSVKEWLVNCGIQLYNTLIGLVPSGDYYMGIPILGVESRINGIPRESVRALTAQLLGNAVVARNYPNLDTFLDDDDPVLMPFQRELQLSINAIWQLEGGPYHWQFDSRPFTSNKTWQQTTIPATSNYWTLLANLSLPRVKYNPNWTTDPNSWGNGYMSGSFFQTYTNMFLNTSNGRVYLMNDSGQFYPNRDVSFSEVYYTSGSGGSRNNSTQVYGNDSYPKSYPVADTFIESVQMIYNSQYFWFSSFDVFIEDFIQHVYVGTNWLNKQEIFNLSDLNISDDMNDYYESPTDDVFIDIRNMLRDLVDTTNIWDTIINNVYDPSGDQIIDMPTIRVSVDLTPITDLLSPALPVNLNDIAELTDNTYLERVKEHAKNFGDIFVNYFAFWHNVDSDIIYTMFGATILVLVGAFIGKWGHS